MSIYHHPIDAISSAGGAAPTYVPPFAAGQGARDVSIGSPIQESPGAIPTASGSTSTQELQKHLAAALKNSGFKAEITNESGGYTVLKIIQTETGQVILQMPTQTALAIVQSLQKSGQNGTGASGVPPGTMMSELA